jgi:hypothetical protein
MILLCGIPTESPLALVSEALAELQAPFLVINQRQFTQWDLEFEITAGRLSGWLRTENRHFALAEIQGVYTHLMDYHLLPEFRGLPESSSWRAVCAGRHDRLARWLEVTPARVLNRAAAMATNFSKPYQAQLIQAAGFVTPPTLITNDPEVVREFRREQGRVIYKSISSVRSIVREFTDADEARLDRIRWCPIQFQAFIEGTNVRVHVVGSRVFATEIENNGADYRYGGAETGEATGLKPKQLPRELEERCVRLAHGLGLPLAGIDLKFTPDGRVFCFEVNPSPGFSCHENNTGQPIARAIAEYLNEPLVCDEPGARVAVLPRSNPAAATRRDTAEDRS